MRLLQAFIISFCALMTSVNAIGQDSPRYIKAATYFGHANPFNFCNSIEPKTLDPDMKRIKKDGFNSIIVMVPWGEFQPGLNPIRYNKTAFKNLGKIVEAARKHNLKVIFRLSYFWDLYPHEQSPLSERFLEVFYDEKVYDAWLGYLSEVYKFLNRYDNVSFSMLSWEDFFIIPRLSKNNLNDRLKLAKKLGYQEYLYKNKYDLSGTSFTSYDNVPIPDSSSFEFKWYMQFWDYVLLDRLFRPAKRIIPNLTLEVRVDKDRILDRGKLIEWYSHEYTFKAPMPNFTTIYYAPFMGMKNVGDKVSAEKCMQVFDYIMRDVTSQTNHKVFVDQFNFYDNTVGFQYNTQIADNDLNKFILGSSKILKKYTNGYAVWTYRDYNFSPIYNSSFEIGTDGWVVNGDYKVLELEGRHSMSLKSGANISQTISGDLAARIVDDPNLCFDVSAPFSNNNIRLNISAFPGTSYSVDNIGNVEKRMCIKVPRKNEYVLRLEAVNGEIILDNIELFSHTQEGRMYKNDNKPDTALEAVRKLNNILK